MLETPRLILRQPCIEDFPATAAMFSHPSVMEHIGGAPLSREGAWARFLRDVGHWTVKGHGLFSIIEKQTGKYVGKAGLACYGRSLGPEAQTDVEASWTIDAGSQGVGYATEAAMAALRWFDEHCSRRTACLVKPANAGSVRVAEKLGYVRARPIERTEGQVLLFVRDAAPR